MEAGRTTRIQVNGHESDYSRKKEIGNGTHTFFSQADETKYRSQDYLFAQRQKCETNPTNLEVSGQIEL